MHALILLLILSAMTSEYLVVMDWVPAGAKYLHEIIAAVLACAVVLGGARNRFRYVHSSYWLMLGAFAAVMLCGVLINAVEAGPVFAGIRSYLRALPLFLLPAVFTLQERHVRMHLLLVLLLCSIQFPIALDQRLTSFHRLEYLSGDMTVGTLMSSNVLSIFMICAACVLTGFYVRRRIRAWLFVPLVLLILAPTTINETKATLLLLPLALLVTFVVGSARGKRLRNGLMASLLLAVFGAIFVPVYDYFMKPRWGYGIVEFFTMEGRVEGYLSKNSALGSRKAGRVDALLVPVAELARDPSTFAFGLGIGNVSDSALGDQFSGHYYRRFEPFLLSSATTYLLETGFLGVMITIALCLLVFRDSRHVAREDEGLYGALAVGWAGVAVTILLAFFYADTMTRSSLIIPFWYVSGLIAAQRMRLADPATVPPAIRARAVPRSATVRVGSATGAMRTAAGRR